MDFGRILRSGRIRAGLTQADIATATGIARPNIAAYEGNRREPRLSTAVDLLAAVDTDITATTTVRWSWTSGRRPFAVPSRLWRIPIHAALATITTSQHIWWSGPDRTLDLNDERQRQRAYEIVLREGTPTDIEAHVDGLLLVQAWTQLVLPSELRHAWQPTIDLALDPDAVVAA
jgi:transcriptional regulator with XRE-family HTH domain